MATFQTSAPWLGFLKFLEFLDQCRADLMELFFPGQCMVCGMPLEQGEKYLCLECDLKMPRTYFHLDNPNHSKNELYAKLVSKEIYFERATAWFHYVRNSKYRNLILTAKYRNRPDVAEWMGQRFATELTPDFFSDIDILMPVPLHWLKYYKRGYNQAEEIAYGISAVTGIPVEHNLYARRGHLTQTALHKAQRLKNVGGVYAVEHPDELDDRHILLIDDVITTGATTLSCAAALHRAAPTARLSVLSLASTHLD